MGLTVGYMRQEIAKVYDTAAWRDKVDDMYDDQVIAIYYDFLNKGKLNKVLKKERPYLREIKEDKKPHETYKQISIFDLLKQE